MSQTSEISTPQTPDPEVLSGPSLSKKEKKALKKQKAKAAKDDGDGEGDVADDAADEVAELVVGRDAAGEAAEEGADDTGHDAGGAAAEDATKDAAEDTADDTAEDGEETPHGDRSPLRRRPCRYTGVRGDRPVVGPPHNRPAQELAGVESNPRRRSETRG